MHTLAIHGVLLLMSRENIFHICSFRDENSHPINSLLSESFYRRTFLAIRLSELYVEF